MGGVAQAAQAAGGLSGTAGDIGNGIGSLGGITNGIAQGFTPQNGYRVDPSMFINAINSAQGNQATNLTNQNQLAQMLLAQSQGQGPNPAQAMLMQNANELAQQQAGGIASQKGINPALAARQMQMQGAQAAQAAAGHAGVMGAQQQLGAQGQLGGLYGQIGNQNLNAQQMNLSALTGAHQTNAGVAAQNAAATQATASGLLSGASSAGMAMAMARGGMVPHYAYGSGMVGNLNGDPAYMPGYGDSYSMPQMGASAAPAQASPTTNSLGAVDMANSLYSQDPKAASATPSVNIDTSASGKIAQQLMAQSGVPMWASGVNFNKGQSQGASQMAQAAPQIMALMAAQGAVVPGRAAKSGNNYANDTVPAVLSPGEIVLPRSVTMSGDAPELAKEFVQHIRRQNAKRGA